MFGKLISHLTSGISNAVTKYALRVSVAVPFVLAMAYGLAALTTILIASYGYREAYLLMTGGFVALGIVSGILVWIKERRAEADEKAQEANSRTTAALAVTAAKTAKELPAAVSGGASDAKSSIAGLGDLAIRNWPVVVAGSLLLLFLGAPSKDNRRRWR
jgi:hypothetical protein